MFVDSGGILRRSTSSIKYKRDLKPYTRGLESLLKLNAVFFKSKPREGEAPNETQYAGFTAENMHEAGLFEFVQYAEDGSPDAVNYPNMAALFANCFTELNDRLMAGGL
jgi:hypothetical protein